MKLHTDPWESPHEMFETFINVMASRKGNPPVKIDITDLPIGSEVVVEKKDEK